MTDLNSLDGLRGLHQDLIALEESQLRNIERLCTELEARIVEFRNLLDKPPKEESSRKTLNSGALFSEYPIQGIDAVRLLTSSSWIGTIQLDEEEYSVNAEFIEGTLLLADALDLDEIAAAQLFLDAQQDTEILDRSNLVAAVIRFHERRQFLLECLRLVLKYSTDEHLESDPRDIFLQLVTLILDTKDGPARNGSLYVQKCLRAMSDIEKWLQVLGERHQGNLTLGKSSTPESDEIIGFQQVSLMQQHESLGALLTYLVKASHTGEEDFYKLLEHLPKLDRWNNLAVHYVPVITAFTSQYGSPEGSASFREARLLNTKIMDNKDSAPWALRNFQAATITWWLAEFSGWYVEAPTGSPVQSVDLDAEAVARSEAFFQALRDGAFQCTLSICSQLRPDDWADQMKIGLTDYLLRDTTALVLGAATSDYFQDMVMEQIETFADAFVTNMPDTLRRFRSEEDEQRKRIRSRLQPDGHSAVSEHELHLERFLLIIAYALGNRTEAADAFWGDTDGNLYGFLQWASKRQSTPRVGAFCEMLRAISKGEEYATSAHRFLLEEGSSTSARIRRSGSLSWAQIIAELNLYTSKIGERSTIVLPANQFIKRPSMDDIDEPESALMLESYLRLTSHICRESAVARSWILSHPTFRVLDVLFHLCSRTVRTCLHACAFNTVRALITNKSTEIGLTIWTVLDQWASGGFAPAGSVLRLAKASDSALAENVMFENIADDVEESSQFIGLLQSLVASAVDESGLNDSLPFPEQLGSTYRMPGIDPYVDFVIGKVFALQVDQLDNSLPLQILRLNILDFAATCLESFNEDLVILANKSTLSVDTAMNASSLLAYVRLHPFSRVMEWMFNERVLVALFAVAHQKIEDVSSASPDGPLVLTLLRSIDVMNLIMDLQSTYLDIVQPLIKSQSNGRSQSVLNPTLAAFEDSVAINLHLIVDLGLYSGTGIQHLTVSSLKLLEKLASSRKLNVQPAPTLGKRLNGNRLISVLEQSNDLERVARSLTLAMQCDLREINQGFNAPGWTIKSIILDFLNRCLSISPDKPSLAHALLGFICSGSDLDIETDGRFSRGDSLFHAILRLVIEYPDGAEGTIQLWSLSIKQKGLQILSTLWASSLTTIFTLNELRTSDFLFAMFLNQATLEPSTLWDGQLIRDPEFMYSDSAMAFEQYMNQRCYLCEYASIEVRLLAVESISSLKARVFSTLRGSTTMPDGEELANLSIFGLLDFVELDLFNFPATPDLKYFTGIDFTITTEADLEDGEYNLKMVEEMMSLHINQLRKTGRLQDPTEEQGALAEAQSLLVYLHGMNNFRRLSSSRSRTLKAWVDLLTLFVKHCDFDQDVKAGLILQCFQIIVPKLERYAAESVADAIYIADLINTLLLELDFNSSTLDGTRAGDVTSDRLLQIFRTALRAITVPGGEVQLREILYCICHRYLTGMAEISSTPIRCRQSIRIVKASGRKLIEFICDDADGGSGTCRISALLLLSSLVTLANEEGSDYLLDSLDGSNFVLVLVETIQDIPQELRETNAQGKLQFRLLIISLLNYGTSPDIPLLLSYNESKFSLLLSIAQSREGAIKVMNSGLFPSIRASGLFAVDPDIGIGT